MDLNSNKQRFSIENEYAKDSVWYYKYFQAEFKSLPQSIT